MNRKTALFALGAMFVVSAAFGAPDKGKKDKTTQVNVCPMTMEASKDSKETGIYGKYTVHFCCPNCKPKFDKLSKKEQQAKIKAAMKPAPKKAASSPAELIVVNSCPITGEAVAGEGGGKTVYGKYEVHFCCGGCKPDFDKLSQADKDKKIASVLKKG